MIVLKLGEKLIRTDFDTVAATKEDAIFIVERSEAEKVLKFSGMNHYGEIEPHLIGFNKVETQQKCIVGTLFIPKLMDTAGARYKMQLFINGKYIILVDDGEFAGELIERIVRKKSHQGETKAMFLYNFFTEFMSKDLEVLGQYEKVLMRIEEKIMEGTFEDYNSDFMLIRKKLLVLRAYYGEIADMGRELEDNEIGIFEGRQLSQFRIISDRADRLMGRTVHLLDYASQVKDAYKTRADGIQSSNMQFLTIISTIFFPLTLITGWYGMNFRNMPGLDNGYPGVVALSLVVVIVCIVVFRIKKIF